jgi:DNA polymerase epsilon subunit 2
MKPQRQRVLILKAFNKYGLKTVRPDALAFLEDLIERHEIEEDQVQESMELLAKAYLLQEGPFMSVSPLAYSFISTDSTGFVSKEILEKVYESMQDATTDQLETDANSDIENHLFFVDAFEMPWWQYSLERQTFEMYAIVVCCFSCSIKHAARSSRPPTIAGSAESRARVLRDRLQIIKRIILRNEHFAPSAFQNRDRQAPLKVDEFLIARETRLKGL